MSKVVNHNFLFRGKRYKKGQVIPPGHAVLKYRTQFVDDIPADISEEVIEAEIESVKMVEPIEQKIIDITPSEQEAGEIGKLKEIGEVVLATPPSLPSPSSVRTQVTPIARQLPKQIIKL